MSEVVVEIRDKSRPDAKPLGPAQGLLECEFVRALNRIPEARLRLVDHALGTSSGRSDDERAFPLSGSGLLALGNELTCTVRDGRNRGEDVVLFEGFVVGQQLTTVDGAQVVEVELVDGAHRLTRNRKTVVHRGGRRGTVAEDALIGELVEAAGLTVGELANTAPLPGDLVQHNCSDWDFMVTRAEVHGMVLDVDGGKVSLRALGIGRKGGVLVQYGTTPIHELSLSLDVRALQPALQSVAWDGDAGALAPERPHRVREPGITLADFDPKQVGTALGVEEQTLYHGAQLTEAEARTWAASRLKRDRFAVLQGRLVLNGDQGHVPLGHVQLRGFNARYDGDVLISAVTHRITQAGWQTELTLGLSAEPFAARGDIADLPAAGLLPHVSDLHLATVAPGHRADPADNYRVLVHLAAAGREQEGVWARVARPDAGANAGLVSLPEPGDEVVLGYLDGDPRYPVILGSLHSADKPPPTEVRAPKADARRLLWTARSGAGLLIDDQQKVVTVHTPGGNRVVVDDESKAITLQDEHGNRVRLSAQGIALESASDVAIRAKGAVTISGSTVDVDV